MRSEVPNSSSSAAEVREFVQRFDPTVAFRALWGAAYSEHADALDALAIDGLPVEELLLCFCRMWAMAPYLGIDSVEAFLRHPRAFELLEAIRRKV